MRKSITQTFLQGNNKAFREQKCSTQVWQGKFALVLRENNWLGPSETHTEKPFLKIGQAERSACVADHKPSLERERKRVLDSGGRVEFQRCWRIIAASTNEDAGRFTGLAISRSLGDLGFKEPRLCVGAPYPFSHFPSSICCSV